VTPVPTTKLEWLMDLARIGMRAWFKLPWRSTNARQHEHGS